MLGTVRFILALLVVLNHLWSPVANKVGAHAVIAFYIVSGYLMTKVIQDSYGLSLNGGLRFLGNRALRVFPIYWVCVALTLVLLVRYGDAFRPYSTITIPGGYDLFRNITLWQLTTAPSLLVPPAWSLWVEFVFYVAMVLLLSRSRLASVVWFAASVIFTAWLISANVRFGERYYPPSAASLFFSAGAMLYWYPPPAFLTSRRLVFWPLLAVFCVLPILSEFIGIDHNMAGFYGAAILFIPIFLISNTKPSATDKWLGDLAYPLFLSHFLCAGVVRLAMPRLQPLELPFLAMSCALSLAFSITAVKLQAVTIERYRSKIRTNAEQTSPIDAM